MNERIFLWTAGQAADEAHATPRPAPDPGREPGAWGPGWAGDLERFGPWTEALFPDPATGPLAGLAASRGADAGPVIVCGPCSSGFDVAWRLMREGLLPPWSSVLAASQWAGRGQLRRQWHSPLGNVYGVLRMAPTRPDQGGPHPDMLPLAAGLALALVLEYLGIEPRIKWPNDVLFQGRKVAGILVEERLGGGEPQIVVGMGVNLVQAPQEKDLREGHVVLAGDLAGTVTCGPLELWSRMAARLKELLASCAGADAARELRAAVEARLAWLGQDVEVRDGTFDKTRGQIVGLEDSGALRLAVHGRDTTCRSGSVYPVNGPWAE